MSCQVQLFGGPHGIGDHLLYLTIAAALREEGREVIFISPAHRQWCQLFDAYDSLTDHRIGKVPMLYPYSNQAEGCRDQPRWKYYAAASGINYALIPPLRPLPDDAIAWAEERRDCVVFCPITAVDTYRMWQMEKWLVLERLLHRAGVRTIALDVPRGRLRYLAGEKAEGMSPAHVAALMQRCRAVVSIDTGLAHLAGLIGAETLVLMVSGRHRGEHVFGSYPTVKTLAPADRIEPEAVLAALGDWLNRSGETRKEAATRRAEGWYDKYVRRPGLDIGCSHDPLDVTFRLWDRSRGDGDATTLTGVPDAKYQTVYASHILEHVHYPEDALRSWWRVLKPGGHLIVVVPHRDLYEKRKELPSLFNSDHKSFWLPDVAEPPCTRSFRGEIAAAIPDAEMVSFVIRDSGWGSDSPETHSRGSFSIEAVLRKPT